jgi:hypothetical protein
MDHFSLFRMHVSLPVPQCATLCFDLDCLPFADALVSERSVRPAISTLPSECLACPLHLHLRPPSPNSLFPKHPSLPIPWLQVVDPALKPFRCEMCKQAPVFVAEYIPSWSMLQRVKGLKTSMQGESPSIRSIFPIFVAPFSTLVRTAAFKGPDAVSMRI